MKILHLTLFREYFDQIAAGEKIEEYREITDYWGKRLGKPYDVIIFKNGYSRNCPAMCVEYLGCEKRIIWHPVLNKEKMVYALKLGEVKWFENYEGKQANNTGCNRKGD